MSLKKHFSGIILKSGHWPARICCLKLFFFVFLAQAAILYRGRQLFFRSLVEGYSGNISLKSGHLPFSICHLKLLLFGGGRVVRWSWVNFQCRGVLQFGLL